MTASLIDMKAIESEAAETIRKEVSTKAVGALTNAMRRVELAKQNLRSAEILLEDVRTQIADGTLPA